MVPQVLPAVAWVQHAGARHSLHQLPGSCKRKTACKPAKRFTGYISKQGPVQSARQRTPGLGPLFKQKARNSVTEHVLGMQKDQAQSQASLTKASLVEAVEKTRDPGALLPGQGGPQGGFRCFSVLLSLIPALIHTRFRTYKLLTLAGEVRGIGSIPRLQDQRVRTLEGRRDQVRGAHTGGSRSVFLGETRVAWGCLRGQKHLPHAPLRPHGAQSAPTVSNTALALSAPHPPPKASTI